MSIYSVDWSNLRSETSILPPDITFKIISEDKKEGVVVKAHRTVLSLLSPVFRAYLSDGGSWHNSGSQIVIKDVSLKPYETMIDFFYKKDFDISNQFRNIEELFEIVEVADRYQVEALLNLGKKSLLSFPFELARVTQIVNTAKYYKKLAPFATISEDIIERIRDFLLNKLKTAADVMNFFAQSETDNHTLEDSIKLELLKSIANRKSEEATVSCMSISNVTHKSVVKWCKEREYEKDEDLSTLKTVLKQHLEKPLVKNDTWYLIDNHWLLQCKKYIGLEGISYGAANPGPIDNKYLFKDDDSGEIRDHIIDDLDYALVPEDCWNILVERFGVNQGQEPIARKVVEHGHFVKYCKVEVYYIEFQLAENSDLETVVKKKFSKADKVEHIEQVMRSEFNISDGVETRLWNKYTSNTYELLARLDNTVQDAGLFSGQLIIIELKNQDGSWS